MVLRADLGSEGVASRTSNENPWKSLTPDTPKSPIPVGGGFGIGLSDCSGWLASLSEQAGYAKPLQPPLPDVLGIDEDSLGGADDAMEVALGGFDLSRPTVFADVQLAQDHRPLLAGADAQRIQHRPRPSLDLPTLGRVHDPAGPVDQAEVVANREPKWQRTGNTGEGFNDSVEVADPGRGFPDSLLDRCVVRGLEVYGQTSPNGIEIDVGHH